MFTIADEKNNNPMVMATIDFILSILSKWSEEDAELKAGMEKPHKKASKMFEYIKMKAKKAATDGVFTDFGLDPKDSLVMEWAVKYYKEDSDETDNFGARTEAKAKADAKPSTPKATATAAPKKETPKAKAKDEEEELSLFDF